MLVHRWTQTGNPISSLFNVYNICSFVSIESEQWTLYNVCTIPAKIYVNSPVNTNKHNSPLPHYLSTEWLAGCGERERSGKLFNEWRKTENRIFDNGKKKERNTHRKTRRSKNISTVRNKLKEKQSTQRSEQRNEKKETHEESTNSTHRRQVTVQRTRYIDQRVERTE